MNQVIETQYSSQFRAQDTQTLGTHIHQNSSVSVIGMKRVGISNFLRFFLNHDKTLSQFIDPKKHILVVVDLNNLVERTLYAFWMLTLKKTVDAIEADSFPEKVVETSRSLFTQSIQLGDLFFTVDAIHKLMTAAAEEGKYVTFFFLRFDRLKDMITQEFFANMKGLRDSGNHISYVFTSYRPLSEIMPVFTRSALPGFVQEMYLKPANDDDMKQICETFAAQYDLKLSEPLMREVIRLSGGHVQYVHLCLIKLKSDPSLGAENLEQSLTQDEEITFLSEEIFSSLTPEEQTELTKLNAESKEKINSKYVLDTGIISTAHSPHLFSPLFSAYLRQVAQTQRQSDQDFTKKEHLLFSLLKSQEGQLVEREKIIETVWPDEVELGVSDWSIDRLVSRVRGKLKAHKSEYKIMTVITRGYKLVKGESET